MKTRAFTWIELLAIIAIISILTSIFLPVPGRAKAVAKRSPCANNLRQIARWHLVCTPVIMKFSAASAADVNSFAIFWEDWQCEVEGRLTSFTMVGVFGQEHKHFSMRWEYQVVLRGLSISST